MDHFFSRVMMVRAYRLERRQVAEGDPHERVEKLLDESRADGVLSLHHRRVPGRRGVVSHLAVGPSGLFVIDVELARPGAGTASSRDGQQLIEAPHAAGFTATGDEAGTRRRLQAIKLLLADAGFDDIAVLGVVCRGDRPPTGPNAGAAPTGVVTVPLAQVAGLVTAPGPVSAASRQAVYELLSARLEPAY